MNDLDPIDRQLVQELLRKGRSTWTELSEKVQLTPPAVAERVRRLEQRGLIQSYHATLNPQMMGLNMMAFISISLDKPKDRNSFLKVVAENPEIQECYELAGEFDYLIKLRCRDTQHLESIVASKITSLKGVTRSRTSISISTHKDVLDYFET